MDPECSTLSLTYIWSGFSSLYFCPPASNDESEYPNGLTATTSVAIASLSASSIKIFSWDLASLISASTWSDSSAGEAIGGVGAFGC